MGGTSCGCRRVVVLVLVVVLSGGGAKRGRVLPPDSTGLVGAPPVPADRSLLLPLKFWANPRKSPLKPRRKDLDESTLLRLMGQDFDSRWMRRTAPIHKHIQDGIATEERAAVRALREAAEGGRLALPEDLVPEEYRAVITQWLVRRATCPIRYVWDDLGPYFWPRWIRRGECLSYEPDAVTEAKNSSKPTCSWPPGMMCVPGLARNLQILRWHCRLRKNMLGGKSNSNNVWMLRGHNRGNSSQHAKRRNKYRCLWLKVPYPVPEDCICSCSSLL